MIIVWGNRFFGDVYMFNGMCVAIRFFHLWYLPVLPMKPYLIMERNAGAWRGVPLPWGSPYARHALLMAYVRGFLKLLCVFGIGAGLVLLFTSTGRISAAPIMLIVIGLAALGLLRLTLEYCVGSAQKIAEIANSIGLRPKARQ